MACEEDAYQENEEKDRARAPLHDRGTDLGSLGSRKPPSRVADIRARFLREGYVANKIGHAGVVRVIDDDVAPDGCVYLVMELLEGRTLEQHRLEAGGRLPIAEALTVGGDVLDILGAAHLQRIIHRDIKPDNVFLTTGGVAKLMDFGIARLLDASHATASGALMGTPATRARSRACRRSSTRRRSAEGAEC